MLVFHGRTMVFRKPASLDMTKVIRGWGSVTGSARYFGPPFCPARDFCQPWARKIKYRQSIARNSQDIPRTDSLLKELKEQMITGANELRPPGRCKVHATRKFSSGEHKFSNSRKNAQGNMWSFFYSKVTTNCEIRKIQAEALHSPIVCRIKVALFDFFDDFTQFRVLSLTNLNRFLLIA